MCPPDAACAWPVVAGAQPMRTAAVETKRRFIPCPPSRCSCATEGSEAALWEGPPPGASLPLGHHMSFIGHGFYVRDECSCGRTDPAIERWPERLLSADGMCGACMISSAEFGVTRRGCDRAEHRFDSSSSLPMQQRSGVASTSGRHPASIGGAVSNAHSVTLSRRRASPAFDAVVVGGHRGSVCCGSSQSVRFRLQFDPLDHGTSEEARFSQPAAESSIVGGATEDDGVSSSPPPRDYWKHDQPGEVRVFNRWEMPVHAV